MTGFGTALGDQAIEDVLALLRNWQVSTPIAPSPPARPPPIPLGPVPLNPKGLEPIGFRAHPATTSADIVKGQLDKRARMALLDARAPSDYAAEHISGAVSVPFYDVEPYVASLPKNAWLVCYCSCPHAESGQLAQTLVSRGFTRVTILDEGLRYWHVKGYPTTSGTLP
jgi:cytochrome c oxidase cbb3-type subunit 3/ubiquinol-cytochrome c reductase cytochrome c subunit